MRYPAVRKRRIKPMIVAHTRLAVPKWARKRLEAAISTANDVSPPAKAVR
jgi:hypothetical protein